MQSISRRLLASQVDVSVGLGAVDEEKNYRNARHARFKTGVVLQYKKREKSASRMEMKRVFWPSANWINKFRQAFTDAFGQYVWLVVHEPIKHRTNPTEIVSSYISLRRFFPFHRFRQRSTKLLSSAILWQTEKSLRFERRISALKMRGE